ncbi:MAG: DNA glycosylase [Peptoniphilaceae bacterium]|nr:8-oxoguanine DNA glycosylase [Peptoniphilaceae bacterium]MDD7383160.1 DNA glycosylase [Peptoniphilaceae bacterium]MDY3738384.1 DNA glycosylase [Peptoniphilaceae bacterium]
MRYKFKEKQKLNIKVENNILEFESDSFTPKDIFECGQAFNFSKEEDGSYTFVAFEKIVNVSDESGKIMIKNISEDDFYRYFYDFFDLGVDYKEVKKSLSKDETLKKACDYGNGIRILNQEIFETIISFIISANNQIPRIKNSVRIISKMYGKFLGNFNGIDYYSFPDAQTLSKAKVQDLREYAKVGFRDERIVETSKMIAEGFINENDLKLNTENLREKLQKLPGVGPKVADCILLFSFHRREVYPVDVWIKRVTETLYIGQEVPKKRISNFAQNIFGDFSGYVNQYLFYYGRENKIGKKVEK